MLNKPKIREYLESTTQKTLLVYIQNRLQEKGEHRASQDLIEQAEALVIAAWEIFLTRLGKLKYLRYFKLWQTRYQEQSQGAIIRVLKAIIVQEIEQKCLLTNEETPGTDKEDGHSLQLIRTYLEAKKLSARETVLMIHHLEGLRKNLSIQKLAGAWNQQQKRALSCKNYEKRIKKITHKIQQQVGGQAPWFVR